MAAQSKMAVRLQQNYRQYTDEQISMMIEQTINRLGRCVDQGKIIALERQNYQGICSRPSNAPRVG